MIEEPYAGPIGRYGFSATASLGLASRTTSTGHGAWCMANNVFADGAVKQSSETASGMGPDDDGVDAERGRNIADRSRDVTQMTDPELHEFANRLFDLIDAADMAFGV